MRNHTGAPALSRRGWAWLKPSLGDLFFPVMVMAVFGRASSWQALLADGDTGWHIRTGEYILGTGSVPWQDLFSFSRAGHPWFAWEWLADVSFAVLFRWRGLEGVAVLAVVVLSLCAVLLLHWLLERGVGLWIALPVTWAAVSASSIHYLARPHIFSLLLALATLRLLDRDRKRPGAAVWTLAPLLALWANLHGGFVCGLAMIGLAAAVAAWERDRGAFGRYGVLTALCAGATLLNPYGWRLHQHIAGYLGSTWIQDSVQEFQSPRIRDENMQVFALLLLAGVAVAGLALARKQWFEGMLVMAWGFAAMRSARHVPLYALAAAPLIAAECERWWAQAAAGAGSRSPTRILWNLSQEFALSRGTGLWTAALAVAAVWMALPPGGLRDFPGKRFPVAAVARNLDRLSPPGAAPRILTSDQWGDYLIFRLYPRQHVFFDGRSDFYGREVGSDYQTLLATASGWREVLTRYRFDLALLPLDWPLGEVLQNEPGWRLVDRGSGFVLLERATGPLKETSEAAECSFVSKSAGQTNPGQLNSQRMGAGGLDPLKVTADDSRAR